MSDERFTQIVRDLIVWGVEGGHTTKARLKEVEGLSDRKAAAQLGVSRTAVRKARGVDTGVHSEPDEPDRIDDDPIEEALDQPGRSPEQKARDLADVAISDLKQRCRFRDVDMVLAMKTLIKLLTDELKMAMPVEADPVAEAEARTAYYASTEELEPAQKSTPLVKKKRGSPSKLKAKLGGSAKKRGRPAGSKNKPKPDQQLAA